MTNETIQTILSRRSIRSYEAKPVEREKIDLILQCGQFAPSGMNRQPWHFTVVTNRKLLDEISNANREILLRSPDEGTRFRAQDPNFDSFRGAPMAIIVSGDPSGRNTMGDCANAIENMALAATALGLGSCYLASFKLAMEQPEGAFLLEKLMIPQGYIPMFALSLGYGNEVLGERAPRKENAITFIE